MELDHFILNKLRYIEDYQKKMIRNNKNKTSDEVNDFYFTNLKGKEYKLLKHYNKKFAIDFKNMKIHLKTEKELLNLTNFHHMQRKLNLLHSYMNLVGLVFMLRYIDMIVVVKRGGI